MKPDDVEKTTRVLLATDGSSDARAATVWLREILDPTRTTLLVMSVAAASPRLTPWTSDVQQWIRTETHRVTEDAVALLGPTWRNVETRVTEGDIRDRIAAAAGEWAADLVVVGARGLGAVKSFLLGGVSLGVVREAPCSVLVVKGESHGLQRAVIALDGSAGAVAALRLFTALPLNRPPSLALIGVVEPIRLPATSPAMIRGVLRAELDRMHAEYREQLARRLDEAAAGLGPQFVAERRVVAGHPAEEIVKAAETSEAGVVVVGARGLGALRRAVLGSVSEHVALHASCPVLVVKPSP